MSRLNQTCSHSERDSLPPNCEWSGQCTVVHLSSGLLWGETAGCFVIRVLNTNASSNRLTSPGTCYISQAWEGKKEEIWRENPWGRAWLILALGLLSNCWGLLQTTCIINEWKEWSKLCDYNGLNKMLHQLLSHSISSDAHEVVQFKLPTALLTCL